IWQTLLTQLLSRYAALDNDRLEVLRAEIEEQRGGWHSFWEPVTQAIRQALLETGIRGAIALCDLIGPTNAAAAPPEALVRQRLFLVNGLPINEEQRATWRKVLAQQGGWQEQIQQLGSGLGELLIMAVNPRQARERAQ